MLGSPQTINPFTLRWPVASSCVSAHTSHLHPSRVSSVHLPLNVGQYTICQLIQHMDSGQSSLCNCTTVLPLPKSDRVMCISGGGGGGVTPGASDDEYRSAGLCHIKQQLHYLHDDVTYPGLPGSLTLMGGLNTPSRDNNKSKLFSLTWNIFVCRRASRCSNVVLSPVLLSPLVHFITMNGASHLLLLICIFHTSDRWSNVISALQEKSKYISA